MYRWYVIQAKPGQADKAQQELENQGYDTFQPKIEVEVIRQGKRSARLEPLFPGYLFIYLSRDQSNWRPIRSTRGVARLVSFGDQPAVMPDGAVEAIRAQLRNRPEPASRFSAKQPVQITEGPFRNLNAVFCEYDGEKRAFVLLELLGRWQRMSINLDELEQ